MTSCLWNYFESHGKLYLANWKLVCVKEFGGIGILNLQEINLRLQESWIRRYSEGDGKLWKLTIDHKYNSSQKKGGTEGPPFDK